jgi:gliding motility-associated-like protein
VACVAPKDNVPPCAPDLQANSICDESRNLLEWTYKESLTFDYDNPSCWEDVEKYRIYYTLDPAKHGFTRIDSVMSRDLFTYSHQGSLVGCYYVTAVDTAGNQSAGSNIVCLDECGEYDLPNVFTPNGDGINDVFKSFNPGRVTRVDMKIYNRWGKLVYKTEDPDINWDGRDIDSKRFVATGVYTYICEVYEERLTGIKTIPLSGFIHVYYGKDAQPYVPPVN